MKVEAAQTIVAAAVLSVVAIAPSAARAQSSQTTRQPEMQVTLVGCVQKEADYRRAHNSGKGGPAGTGVGLNNEYVLVNASKVETGGAAPPKIDCSAGASASGDAYELTGSHESDVKPFVGHWVQITGKMKEAKVATGTAGTTSARPTGGFDPLKQDLKLFEVDVQSVRDAGGAPSAAAATPAAPVEQSAARTPTPAPPAPASQAAATSGRDNLPHTASPMPSVMLLGALFLAMAVTIRLVRSAI